MDKKTVFTPEEIEALKEIPHIFEECTGKCKMEVCILDRPSVTEQSPCGMISKAISLYLEAKQKQDG